MSGARKHRLSRVRPRGLGQKSDGVLFAFLIRKPDLLPGRGNQRAPEH